jgi:hypothetical protein
MRQYRRSSSGPGVAASTSGSGRASSNSVSDSGGVAPSGNSSRLENSINFSRETTCAGTRGITNTPAATPRSRASSLSKIQGATSTADASAARSAPSN